MHIPCTLSMVQIKSRCFRDILLFELVRKKLCYWLYLNPQPLDYKVCALPLCYHRCPGIQATDSGTFKCLLLASVTLGSRYNLLRYKILEYIWKYLSLGPTCAMGRSSKAASTRSTASPCRSCSSPGSTSPTSAKPTTVSLRMKLFLDLLLHPKAFLIRSNDASFMDKLIFVPITS